MAETSARRLAEIVDSSGNVTLSNFVGMIAPFAMSSTPSGWLPCQGGEVLQTDYPDLYDLIGETWNTTIDPTTGSAHSAPSSGYFRLPDFRGVFLRGVGTASGKSDAVAFAGYQGEKTARPSTAFTGSMAGSATTGGSSSMYLLSLFASTSGNNGTGWAGHVPWRGSTSSGQYVTAYPGIGHTHSVSVSTSGSITGGGDDETRPLNFGVYYWIKY